MIEYISRKEWYDGLSDTKVEQRMNYYLGKDGLVYHRKGIGKDCYYIRGLKDDLFNLTDNNPFHTLYNTWKNTMIANKLENLL